MGYYYINDYAKLGTTDTFRVENGAAPGADEGRAGGVSETAPTQGSQIAVTTPSSRSAEQ